MSRALRKICQAMETIAPLHLAEKWDNVGLLLDTKTPITAPKTSTILLCNDISEAVMTEALEKNVNVIITYHPIWFSPLKRLVTSHTISNIILTAASNGIAIYSPHTAADSAVDGVNDWLVRLAVSKATSDVKFAAIQPHATIPGAGVGRRADLDSPLTLPEIIETLKASLGLKHVRVGLALKHGDIRFRKDLNDIHVRSVAVCGGSGASVLGGVAADLYICGEMGHHEVLAATHAQSTVILLEHSNSERGWLATLKTRLARELEIIVSSSAEVDSFEILISETDRDPLFIV